MARRLFSSVATEARPSDSFFGWLRRLFAHPAFGDVLHAALLLAVFVIADRLLATVTRLPASSYEEPVIALEFIRALPDRGAAALVLLLLMLGVVAAAVLRARPLGPRWDAFDDGARLRIFIGVVAFTLTWTFSTYEYNAYFGQTHEADRLLLIAMAALTIWRPFFVFPLLLVLMPVIQQFDHPIGGFSGAQAMLLVRVLILFVCAFALTGLTKRSWTSTFLFLTCCMVASSYWWPGTGKLALGWLTRDNIHFLLPSTYANGWLGFFDRETIGVLTGGLSAFNWPMKFVTLLGEVGALLCLWSRSSMRFLLVLWIILHAGIFLLSGIFFWMWVLLNISLLLLFFRSRSPERAFFRPEHFLLSVIVIAGGNVLFRPAKLAWLETRATYTYRLVAGGDSLLQYPLPPRYFAPYDYQFTMGDFHYLQDRRHLPIVWGATYSRAVADTLNAVREAAELPSVEEELGRMSANARQSQRFDSFVRRFVRNKEAGHFSGAWWRAVPAPPDLWTFPLSVRDVPERVRSVSVYQVLSFYDGRRYREVRRRPVRFISMNGTNTVDTGAR